MFRLVRYAAIILIGLMEILGSAQDVKWQKITDGEGHCQASVPPDWKAQSFPDRIEAVGPSGRRAALLTIRLRNTNQSKQIFNAYKSNGSLKVVEQNNIHWIGKIEQMVRKPNGATDLLVQYLALVPPNQTFTCDASLQHNSKSLASQAELDAAVKILNSVELVKGP